MAVELPPVTDNKIYRFKETSTAKPAKLSRFDIEDEPYSKARSYLYDQLSKELKPIDLDKGPSKQLVRNMRDFGFAVINPSETDKDTIEDAFDAFEEFSKQNHSIKKKLRNSNPWGSYELTTRPDYNKRKGPDDQKPLEHDKIRFLDDLRGSRNFFFEPGQHWKEAQADMDPTYPDLRECSVKVMEVLERNSQKILQHIAKLFKLEPGFFKKHSEASDNSTLRMMHCISADEAKEFPQAYPIKEDALFGQDDLKEATERDCIQVHTDWGLITLLPKATVEGLEFWFDDKKNDGINSGWVKLEVEEGQLIAMPGNMMDIISGGRLRSIPHRVASDQTRSSIAYFTELNKNVDIQELKREAVKGFSKPERKSFFEKDIVDYLEPGQSITSDNYIQFMGNIGRQLRWARKNPEENKIDRHTFDKAKKLGFRTDYLQVSA